MGGGREAERERKRRGEETERERERGGGGGERERERGKRRRSWYCLFLWFHSRHRSSLPTTLTVTDGNSLDPRVNRRGADSWTAICNERNRL